MKSYELIREIPNRCSNNQMRDVFIEEVECESPMAYVRSLFPAHVTDISEETDGEGQTVIFVNADGLTQKFIFTE